MGSARILVVSTVHRADDTRIREKLIPTLAPLGTITYATRAPEPSSRTGIERWIELAGGRLWRNLAALRLLAGRSDPIRHPSHRDDDDPGPTRRPR